MNVTENKIIEFLYMHLATIHFSTYSLIFYLPITKGILITSSNEYCKSTNINGLKC